MHWRVIAITSVGLNVGLAAIWLLAPRHRTTGLATTAGALGQAPGGTSRTNVVLRRQFFSWQEVEATDYPAYIANLRGIGCPEQTIRDIIIADVNGLYARRRASELVTPEQQWWRSEPDPVVARAASQKSRELEEERRGLLTRLLGISWESGDLVSLPRPSRTALSLDGTILGNLPTETKQAIQEINQRSEARLQAYLDAQRAQGKNPDPAEVAKLRQQTRDELARFLSPAQLEEFLLRYSQNANALRSEFGQLRYFNATPDEFRAVFRAIDPLDRQIQLLADATDPTSIQNRQALEAQRDNALKIALGDKRYHEYMLLHDPLYQDAVASAIQAGTPDSAQTLYQINQAAAATQQSITNSNLTAAQRAIELKQLELDQLKASTLATGQDLPPEQAAQPQTPPRRTYTVRQGDSAAVVASIYGIPESAIRAANPNVDFNRLRPGDSITIPRSALPPMQAPRISPNGP